MSCTQSSQASACPSPASSAACDKNPSSGDISADVFDILKMSHIDAQFAWEILPEFVIYWKDSNQLYKSWNTKFLQHVKYQWAKRNEISTHGGQQGTPTKGRSRDRSLSDDLTDRSWAT